MPKLGGERKVYIKSSVKISIGIIFTVVMLLSFGYISLYMEMVLAQEAPPSIYNIVPANNSWILGTATQLFEITITDTDNDLNTSNVTMFYTESSEMSESFGHEKKLDCYGATSPYTCNTTFDLSLEVEYDGGNNGRMQYYFEATDNIGGFGNNGSTSSYYTTRIDRTSPKYSLNQTNSTIAGVMIIHSLFWEDTRDLGGYIFSFDNCTGSFVNDSFVGMSGTSAWSNVSKVVNSSSCTIQWIVYANDSAGSWNISETYSYSTTDETAPEVTLNSPTDDGLSMEDVTFSCTVTDNFALSNVSLYGNWSGWHANETNTSGVEGNYIFTKTLAENIYVWNCYACDSSSNCAMATSNYTVRVDNENMNLTFTAGQSQIYNISLPKYVYYNNATVDLKGFGNITTIDQTIHTTQFGVDSAVYGSRWLAQNFTLNDSVNYIESISLRFSKWVTPLWNVTVSLRETITGTDFANVSININDSFDPVNFTFNTNISTGNTYFFVVRCENCNSTDHYVTAQCEGACDYPEGDVALSTDGGATWEMAAFTDIGGFNIYTTYTPENLTMDVGNDNNVDFDTGQIGNKRVVDLNVTAIDSFLGTCSPIAGNCTLPVNITIETGGIIYIDNLNLEYSEAGLIECGGASNTTALRFTLYDEENRTTAMNGSLEAAFHYWSGDDFFNQTFNFTNQSVFDFCVFPTWGNFNLNATIEYTSTGYDTRNYFLVNFEISNTTESINLYAIEDSLGTNIEFEVLNSYHVEQEGVIVKAQRYFTADDDYLTVGMGRTGYDGKTMIPQRQYVYYRFILERDGVVLNTYSPQILIDTSQELYIDAEQLFEFFEYWDSLAYTCTYNNATYILSCTFSDTSGHMVEVYLYVTEKRPAQMFVTVCEDSSTSNAGTLTCNVSDYQDSTLHYELRGRFSSDPTLFTMVSAWLEFAQPALNLGLMGILMAFVITITLSFVGLWNPAISILFALTGVVISFAFGLLQVTFASVIALGIVAGIIIYKVRT